MFGNFLGYFEMFCSTFCPRPVWPDKNHKMSIKVAQIWFHYKKWMISAPLQKLPKNVGDLGKLIVAKGFKKSPKVQKIANSGHTVGELELF